MKPVLIATAMALASLVFAAVVSAKVGTIHVFVTDAVSGSPLENAVVTLENAPGSAISDASGLAVLHTPKAGRYVVRVTHGNYKLNATATVELTLDRIATIHVKLTPLKDKSNGNYEDKLNTASHQATGVTTDSQSTSESVLKSGQSLRDAPSAISSDNTPGVQADSYIDTRMEKRIMAGQSNMPMPSLDRYNRQYSEPELPPFDMYFREYGTHGFVDPRRDAQSTFGLDVDDASYTLVRRYLTEGNIPPAEAVRVEEFVNHFDYGYNSPDDGTFRIFSELTPSPFRDGVWMLKLGIKAREVSDWQRKPARLVVVIDESGSMGYDTRLQLVKRSVEILARQLDRDDRIAIVAYRDNARIVLRWTRADRINDVVSAIGRIHPGGSTNVAAGLEIAYRLAGEQYSAEAINRIVLFSDGVANVGPTSADAIMRCVSDQARRGINLSTFGVGMGNYNDALLEQLAIKGNGRYAYLNNSDEVEKQLADQFTSALQVVARDAKIQVTFDPSQVAAYRLIGYENRNIADEKFRDRRQDGGEIGAGHEVTALYELVVDKRHKGQVLADVSLRWNDVDRHEVIEINREIAWSDGSRSYQQSRPELKLAIVVAEFALALKGSDYSTVNFEEISRQAQAIVRAMPNEQTRELADLVSRAGAMYDYHADDRDDDRRYGDYKR